jgi:hypothetical protein
LNEMSLITPPFLNNAIGPSEQDVRRALCGDRR